MNGFSSNKKRKTPLKIRKVLFLNFPITPNRGLLLGRPPPFSFSNLKVLRECFSFYQAKWSIVCNFGFWITLSRVILNFVHFYVKSKNISSSRTYINFLKKNKNKSKCQVIWRNFSFYSEKRGGGRLHLRTYFEIIHEFFSWKIEFSCITKFWRSLVSSRRMRLSARNWGRLFKG